MSFNSLQALEQASKPNRRFTALLVFSKAFSLLSMLIASYYFARLSSLVLETSEKLNTTIICNMLGLKPTLESSLVLVLVFTAVSILFRQLSQAIEQCYARYNEKNLNRVLIEHFEHHGYTAVKHYTLHETRNYLQLFTQQIADYLSQFQIQKLLAVVHPIILIAVLFYHAPLIALAIVIALPTVPLFMIIIGSKTAKMQKEYLSAFEQLGNQFGNRYMNAELIVQYQASEEQAAQLSSAEKHLNTKTLKVLSVAFLNGSVIDFFTTLTMAIIAVLIGFDLLGEVNIVDELTFSNGFFILLISPMILADLKLLGQRYHQKRDYEVAKDKLTNFLSLSEKTKTQSIAWRSGKIEIKHFNISKSELTAPELTINQGDKILLLGPSGAGKTLLMSALAGEYPATHQLDVPIAQMHQRPVILPGSLRYNLQLDHSIDDDTLLSKLGQVELTEWFSRFNNLDQIMSLTPALSGGEKQRLALARILLSQREVIFLDEPTAYLTETMHQNLSQAIRSNFQNKTIIWASHRALPTQWFDQIWKIDNGVIVRER